MVLVASLVACGPAQAPAWLAAPVVPEALLAEGAPTPPARAPDRPIAAPDRAPAPADRAHLDGAPPMTPAPADGPCAADADCGYAPDSDLCTADPRANRQPPLIDQGLVCYCDARDRRCALLRVPPVPCESDASCAVHLDPRPHPVAASAAHPHERGRACRDFALSTTCEHTNICTMHRLACPGARR